MDIADFATSDPEFFRQIMAGVEMCPECRGSGDTTRVGLAFRRKRIGARCEECDGNGYVMTACEGWDYCGYDTRSRRFERCRLCEVGEHLEQLGPIGMARQMYETGFGIKEVVKKTTQKFPKSKDLVAYTLTHGFVRD